MSDDAELKGTTVISGSYKCGACGQTMCNYISRSWKTKSIDLLIRCPNPRCEQFEKNYIAPRIQVEPA